MVLLPSTVITVRKDQQQAEALRCTLCTAGGVVLSVLWPSTAARSQKNEQQPEALRCAFSAVGGVVLPPSTIRNAQADS